jgi:hypothetical protein
VWAFARQALNLTEADFWRLTPIQFSALVDRWQTLQGRLDYRAGLICAVMVNCHIAKGRRPFKPEDFMPGLKEEQTPQQMRQVLLGAARMTEKINARK